MHAYFSNVWTWVVLLYEKKCSFVGLNGNPKNSLPVYDLDGQIKEISLESYPHLHRMPFTCNI